MQIKALTFIFLISFCYAQVQVQSLGKSGLENALLMERKGDLQEAQKIYELILETKPKNRQAFNRLKNIYKRLGNYMATAELISNWLIHFPHDIQQRVELGEIFYISDNHEQAERVWDEFILQYGQNTSAYRMLVHTYSRLGLGEKMIQLAHDGRQIFADPDFMALEMGHFYHSRQNVKKALTEYLVFAQYNPRQHKTILDKLLIISDDKEALPIIEHYLIKQINLIFQQIDTKKIRTAKLMLKKYKNKIVLPVDVKVAVSGSSKPMTVSIKDIPNKYTGYDIGPESFKLFTKELSKAKSIFWNGPLGMYENRNYARSTYKMAKLLSKKRARVIVGGGDTANAVKRFEKDLYHVSTGGGASLELISGKKLPAIIALENN